MNIDHKIKEINECIGELVSELIKPSATFDSKMYHSHFWTGQIAALLYDISKAEYGKKDKDKEL